MPEKTTTTPRPFERTQSAHTAPTPSFDFGRADPETKTDRKRADHSNREAAPERLSNIPAPDLDIIRDTSTQGGSGAPLTTDPKVQALIDSGKDLEVGGDNILREVKKDKTR